MARFTAYALRTLHGDLNATWNALVAGTPMGTVVVAVNDALNLAQSVCGQRPPDVVIVATTKGDLTPYLMALAATAEHAELVGNPWHVAKRVSAAVGAPALVISAACASGTTALGIAQRRCAAGQRVLVVAMDFHHPFIHDGFSALGAIDPMGCRPFDRHRAGLQLGSGVAAVLLEPSIESSDDAGVHVIGSGASLDAVHVTAPDRTGSGLVRACRLACELPPDAIMAHGTGTRFNDDAESACYHQWAPGVAVLATKGGLGHTLGAAGLVDTILAVEMIRRRALIGSATTTTPGCVHPIHLVPPGQHAWSGQRMVIANAGFGGINAAVCVSSQPQTKPLHRSITAVRGVSVTLQLNAEGCLPPPMARQELGRVDASWGRMDLASRACVALLLRLGTLPAGTGIILLTADGCAESDRLFEATRQSGFPDAQRFPYTLSSTPIGEASVRVGLTGPGVALYSADAQLVHSVLTDYLATEVPAMVMVEIETEQRPHVARATIWTRAEDTP